VKKTEDAYLHNQLEELRWLSFADGSTGPNPIPVFEAIGRVIKENKVRTDRGLSPYPLPGWIDDYLLMASEKIARLSLGIAPEALQSIPFDEVGALRKVRQVDGRNADGTEAERFRDTRSDHVAAALGFAGDGGTAFRRHDKLVRDAQYLRIYDDPDLGSSRDPLVSQIQKIEGIGSVEAVRNRMAKARKKSHHPTSAPNR